MTAGWQAPAGRLSARVGPWDGGQMGPECRVCTRSLDSGLAGVTPSGGAVDAFKATGKQVSLSLALGAPVEPGRRSHTREAAEQASAGQAGRLLWASAWNVSRGPGPGVRMRSSTGRAWAPAPQGPWSEQPRMDALPDSMRRGDSGPGWAGHRACGPDPVSPWKRSHTDTRDLCPGLSRWSGLAWAPSGRPPPRTRDSALALRSVHGPPPTGGEGTSPCPCQLGTGQSELRGVGTRPGVLSGSPLGCGGVRAARGGSRSARGRAGCCWFPPLFLGSAHTCSTACDVHLPGRGHAEQPHTHTASWWA